MQMPYLMAALSAFKFQTHIRIPLLRVQRDLPGLMGLRLFVQALDFEAAKKLLHHTVNLNRNRGFQPQYTIIIEFFEYISSKYFIHPHILKSHA